MTLKSLKSLYQSAFYLTGWGQYLLIPSRSNFIFIGELTDG